MIEFIAVALVWVGWVRLVWRAPWWAVVLPRAFRRDRARVLASWAREAGYCRRHHAFAGDCPDTRIIDGVPWRWAERCTGPITVAYGWERFDGTGWRRGHRL